MLVLPKNLTLRSGAIFGDPSYVGALVPRATFRRALGKLLFGNFLNLAKKDLLVVNLQRAEKSEIDLIASYYVIMPVYE